MTTFYLDAVGGNDSNDGTTFANRWKTITSGATAARIAPGDTIRIKASPEPTLVDSSASWTNNSKTVTLSTAVTTTIDNGETAWTPSTDVTTGSLDYNFKQGARSEWFTIASGFTTGKAAYRATGTLNLSGYQQVSFWIRSNVALAANVAQICLCTDTAGATVAHTINVPAIVATDRFYPVVVDLGTNMNSAIASVALYFASDPGSVTIYLDNIIACKASSSADSLTHASLIGKKWNLKWAASTSYAQNECVRPLTRNGLIYKKTNSGSHSTGSSEPSWPTTYGESVTDGSVTWQCFDVEETWWGIKNIDGTTVNIDNHVESQSNSGFGYTGTTETAPLYKREPIRLPGAASTTVWGAIQEDGSISANSTYSGGWNTTDMSTQTGETWLDGCGWGTGIEVASKLWIKFENLHMVRWHTAGFSLSGSANLQMKFCSANNCYDGIVMAGGPDTFAVVDGLSVCSCGNTALTVASGIRGRRARIDGLAAYGTSALRSVGDEGRIDVHQFSMRFNFSGVQGAFLSGARFSWCDLKPYATGSGSFYGDVLHLNCNVNDEHLTTQDANNNRGNRLIFHNYNRTADDHRLYFNRGAGGSDYIITDATTRHTASGFAWKFYFGSTYMNELIPQRLSLAKIYCEASVAKTITVWTRRDSTDVKCRLLVRGGQIAGVGDDVTVTCEPSINTWTQSSNLQFTPTAAGVVEVEFWAWTANGSPSGYSAWVDDLSVT